MDTSLVAAARPAIGHRLRRGRATETLLAVLGWLAEALEVRRQRKALLGLSDPMLKDIGLSRADALRETGRRFWDLPGGR